MKMIVGVFFVLLGIFQFYQVFRSFKAYKKVKVVNIWFFIGLGFSLIFGLICFFGGLTFLINSL
ncbi:immunity protein [Lactococcus nasutitermitis]|uniref:Immunity protein n=1 Tax=Lactococcus nasutitermitis TaxID=1652957 RepID=A0ABV9JA32_9LACT|nr:immunity protein [Lactococcus nasutitermitis]